MLWNIVRIVRIIVSSLIFYIAFQYAFKRWGDTIEEWLIATTEAVAELVTRIRRFYHQIRQIYSPTALWLLAHLIPLTIIATAASVNRVIGLEIPIRSLFMAAATVMVLEAAIFMFLMRDGMKGSLLFAPAAYLLIFKPWEDPLLMSLLGSTTSIAILIVLAWHPEKILERIRKELNLPFEEGEFLAKLKTWQGFLLILVGVLVRIAQWATELVQDWKLQVNVKQFIMLPINLIVLVGFTVLLQYPAYHPLDEYSQKVVHLTRIILIWWALLWMVRWMVELARRYAHLQNHFRQHGPPANLAGYLVTNASTAAVGLVITGLAVRVSPLVVSKGTSWLYAEALPYFDSVGNFAARIIAALT